MDFIDGIVQRNQVCFARIGFFCITIFLLKRLTNCSVDLYNLFFGRFFVRKRLHRFGEWAVITGCTRGVGLEFSRQLANLGLNLVLIGRNETLLNKLQTELRSKHDIKIVTVQADLNDLTSYEAIFSSIDQLDIGILINNAGLMYEYPEYFHDVDRQKLTDIVNVNINASQLLSHYVIKRHMLSKNKGLVVFLSSSACQKLTPMMSCYSASKKYIEYMAACLKYEYAGSNIFIQTLLPNYIATDMTQYSDVLKEPSLLSPAAETYVRHCIRTLGFTHETTGYLPHTVLRWCSSLVHERVWTFFALRLMKRFRESGKRKKLN